MKCVCYNDKNEARLWEVRLAMGGTEMKRFIALLLVLALCFAGCRSKQLTEEETEPRDHLLESREPVQSEIQETIPPETQENIPPETKETVPPETKETIPPVTEEDIPAETEDEVYIVDIPPAPVRLENDYSDMVEELLDESDLARTAVPVSECQVFESHSGKLSSLYVIAPGAAVAHDCAQRAANPIAAFRELVGTDLFTRVFKDKKPVALDLINYDFASSVCSTDVTVHVQPYSYNRTGCELLMRDIILMASYLDGGSVYELWLQDTPDGSLPEIHYSEADECYYGYFIYYNEIEANMLCVYIRSGDGRNITDLEFQTLDLSYYFAEPSAGISISLAMDRVVNDSRIAAMIKASEMLLTGKTQLQMPDNEDMDRWTLKLPMSYTLGEWSVKVYTDYYSSTAHLEEWIEEMCALGGRLITYRIRK